MTDAASQFCRELIRAKGSPPVIGGMVLHRIIGFGGMGVVFQGTHLRLRIPVAVKFLFDEPSNGENMSRFVDEASLSARINSPYVVRVYDVNKEDAFQYIVQEFVDGDSAEKRLCDALMRRVPLSEEFVLNVAADATRGLEAIHAVHYLHLDIKPVNLMVGKRDNVTKILDFGLAQPYRVENIPGTPPRRGTCPVEGGTPGYASPEQLQVLNVGPSSDIYSLGVTIYEMLSGRRAFAVENWDEALAAQCHQELQDIRVLRPDISRGTAEWLKRCVHVDPALRFATAMESLAQLSYVAQSNVSRRHRPETPPSTTPVVVPVPHDSTRAKTQAEPLSPMVFCVDNDLAAMSQVVDVLFEASYWVEAFSDGAEVLHRMRSVVPDLVLIEIDLPVMNGLQVCSAMRSNPALKHVPIVFLTSDLSSETLKMALREGASDYLFKPIQPAEVLARVQCLTRLSRIQRELSRLEGEYQNFQKRLSTLTGTNHP